MQKIKDKIHLKKGIIGSERWGEKMRRRITEELGIELYDIYGLTEIYGPGIGISCSYDCGMHYWDDYIYIEIIGPVSRRISRKENSEKSSLPPWSKKEHLLSATAHMIFPASFRENVLAEADSHGSILLWDVPMI